MTEKEIARINELYKKSKTVGLTAEEKEEQAKLRTAYINAMRKNLRGQLDTIKIVNPDGSVIDVKKRHEERMTDQKKNLS